MKKTAKKKPAKRKTPEQVCQCGHHKSAHATPDGSCIAIRPDDGDCKCDHFRKFRTVKARVQKPSAAKLICDVVAQLHPRDRSAGAKLRSIVRLAKRVERLEIAAKQVVHHSHDIAVDGPKSLRQAAKRTEQLRIALTELGKAL